MFENIAPKNSQEQNGAQDMFAGVEKKPSTEGGAAGKFIPPSVAPSMPPQPPMHSPPFYNSLPERGRWQRVLLIIVLAVGLLVLVVLGGWWAYSRWIQGKVAGRVVKTTEENLPQTDESSGVKGLQPQPGEEQGVVSEKEVLPVEPVVQDSDGDGVSDAEERAIGTNPQSVDTDNDGLFDGEERTIYHTNPNNPDTDGDSYLDGEEIRNGFDPNGPGKLLELPR